MTLLTRALAHAHTLIHTRTASDIFTHAQVIHAHDRDSQRKTRAFVWYDDGVNHYSFLKDVIEF